MIYCLFLKQQSEGLDFPLYPGKIGTYIYKNISKKAWKIWQDKQTMIINEYNLNMINNHDRKIIEKEMINFLFKNNKDNI